jgi:hypothetical protein
MVNKHKKTSLKRLDQKMYDDAVTQLNLMNKAELITFFEKIFAKKGYKLERKHGGIFLSDKNCYIFFKFGFEFVTKADIVRVFNAKGKSSNAYLIAENFSEEVTNFALRFDNLTVVNAKTIYEYLKEQDSLPENKYQLNKPSIKRLQALKSLIDRKKAKNFALYGILFLFMSFFVVLKVYYLVCSAVFLIFSLVCLLFGEKKRKTT